MFRRNTAGQVFLVGPLLNKTTMADETSGAAVTVVREGTAAAGEGTLAHVSSGVWAYTPTQAETDAASFALVLAKAGAAAVPFTAFSTRYPAQTVNAVPAAAAGSAGGLALHEGAATLTAAERGAVADKLLGRAIAGGVDGGRTVAQALAQLRNKVLFDVPAAGEFTVYAADDATPLWTGTYVRGPSHWGPLVGVDPV